MYFLISDTKRNTSKIEAEREKILHTVHAYVVVKKMGIDTVP